MKFIFTIIILLKVSFSVFSQNSTLSSGKWKVVLQINDSIQLPFQLNIEKTPRNSYEFTILNASETIEIKNYTFKKDSLFLDLPVFNSQFELRLVDTNTFNGLWRNLAKGENYTIPTKGYKSSEKRFNLSPLEQVKTFSGRYETYFSDTEETYPATGLFQQNKDKITGTFLTETGDYRFLEGNINGNKVFLSCFDGSHAFYFDGTLINDTIKGVFLSGIHYQSKWIAFKNDKFKLQHSDSITQLINTSDIRFSLPDLDSNIFQYPNERYKNKVTIIQIMGSWCPNCMDETKMYKELYSTYHKEGLEIITIAFEVHKTFSNKVAAVNKLKNHFNIEYQILLADDVSKGAASKLFPNLNGITSFPTSIFIDKNNKIRRLHTGFSGPGTGDIYKNYLKKTSLFIETLLKE